MKGLLNFKDYFKVIRRQMILNSYYTREIKGGKSIYASLIDWIFITLFLILFFLITIFNSTGSIIWTITLTTLLVGIYIVLLVAWKRRARYKRIMDINEKLANKQIVEEIGKYGNRDFLKYIKELLEKYYKTTFFEYNNNIDFIGEINGEIYGVKCFKNSPDNIVILKDLEFFVREMENKNIQEGILITSTSFADEVKEETEYLLIDLNRIIEMLKEIEEYPQKDEIEELIVAKHRNWIGDIKNSLNISRKDKIFKFILLGVILYTVSPIVAYSLYYRIMAFVCFGLGIIIGVYNLLIYARQ